MTEEIAMHVKLTLQAGGICTGCGAFVYANLYHKCGEPYRKGGPEGEITDVTPAAAPADAGWLSYPPKLTQTDTRTECEACHGPLSATEPHYCGGNEHRRRELEAAQALESQS